MRHNREYMTANHSASSRSIPLVLWAKWWCKHIRSRSHDERNLTMVHSTTRHANRNDLQSTHGQYSTTAN